MLVLGLPHGHQSMDHQELHQNSKDGGVDILNIDINQDYSNSRIVENNQFNQGKLSKIK